MLLHSDILAAAFESGFNLCGIARCRALSEREDDFRRWLECGFDSSLDYMRRGVEKRLDPSLLLPDARSVAVCAVSYKNEISEWYDRRPDTPKIASYACTADYHDTIKSMLGQMAEKLGLRQAGIAWRCFTDSAPMLEKAWAVEAGLGWIGRNSLLVTPRYGSFMLLGELVTDAPVDMYDTPYAGNGCGECRRCIEACPNSAITSRRVIDTRRCISRLTVEKGDADVSSDLHGWVFGCDVCQNVCPYNRKAPKYTCAAFGPVLDPRRITRRQWAEMSESEFASLAGRTPLRRGGYERIRRLCGYGKINKE